MRKILALISFVCFIIVVALVFFIPAAYVRQPAADAKAASVIIPVNATLDQVISALTQTHVLQNGWGYRFFSHLDDAANHPIAGAYSLKPGMSYRQLAHLLARGPARIESEVRVIEGWDIADISRAVAAEGADVRPSDFFVERFVKEFSFLKGVPVGGALEGYLFPDTYRVWKDELPDALIRKQLMEFGKHAERFETDAKAQGRTLHDVVTLASIIEREVPADADRSIVAGIFWNRLQDGMPLQSDATVNYVTGGTNTRASLRDIETVSPYNTYRYKGLPPGPISNPSLSSLEAALHPGKTAYRYFLSDVNGKVYYAKTLDEHIRNRRAAFGE